MTTTTAQPPPLVRFKVRAGFYRCGTLCIHRGSRWSVYHQDRRLAHFRTLDEAHWWASTNQPTPAEPRT